MKRESDLEDFLERRAAEMGGVAVKVTCPGKPGFPDRLVLLPGGRWGLIETKRRGQALRPLQAWWRRRLQSMGVTCEMADSEAAVDSLLNAIAGLRSPGRL